MGRGKRLDQVLAHLGLGSRKEVRRLIRKGWVRVGEEVVQDPDHLLDPETTPVFLRGKPLSYRRHHHLLLHKPAGYVTGRSEAEGPSVFRLLPEPYRGKVEPVGRLDKDTEGLLLFTSDGALLHRLTHPRYKVEKVYYARLEAPAQEAYIRAFAQGLKVGGEAFLPARLFILSPFEVELRLVEGRHHQVKRMFQAVGNRVVYLKRLSLGPLSLDLAAGMVRPLGEAEEEALCRAVGLPLSPISPLESA